MAATLHPADYAIFSLTLVVSAAVGVYFSVISRRRGMTSTKEYLLGSRMMPVIPTALSVLTSILSSILLIGIPAEIYQRGVNAWIYTEMGAVSMILNAFFFLPVFYQFQPTSVHDYFVARFQSTFLRTLIASLFVISTLFYMSIVMYAPAAGLGTILPFPTWVFILSVGLVCTFYTTLGGLKAVVWTDTIQATVMFAGVLVMVVKGTMDAGGMERVWAVAAESGRLDPVTQLDPNPFQYMSLWIAVTSSIPFWLAQYGVSQMAVQRYCSLPTLKQARQVVAITAPAFLILSSLPCFLGLIMLAYFSDCDPLVDTSLEPRVKRDSLVIYFVAKTLGAYPGLPGLFLACLCSGTLSTVSSGVNSMVAVVWEDLIPKRFFGDYKERWGSAGTKALALILGLMATGLAFACEPLGGVMKAMQGIVGGFTGPLTGLFALGILFPFANRNGAILGALVSISFVVWILVGGEVTGPYRHFQYPPMAANCSGNQSVAIPNHSDQYGQTDVFILYRISHWLYPLVGFLLVILFGVLGSLILPCKIPVKAKFGEHSSTTELNDLSPEALTISGVWRLNRRRPFKNGETDLMHDRFQMHRR